MTDDKFVQCVDAQCGLRTVAPPNALCPLCRSQLAVTSDRYENVVARRVTSQDRELIAVFDNVRSAHNVGSMLRTAEAFGVTATIHCGVTPSATHPKVAKAALGSELRIAAKHVRDGAVAVAELSQAGFAVVAAESKAGAMSLADCDSLRSASKLALVVGNEIAGIDQAILAFATAIVALPIAGEKNSLNVGHAFAVIAHHFAR